MFAYPSLHVFSPCNAVQHWCIDSSHSITNSSPSAAGTQPVPISQGVQSCVMNLFPLQISSHLISHLCYAGRGLSCCTLVQEMSPLENTIVLAHPALPESSSHWEMCSKSHSFFLTVAFAWSLELCWCWAVGGCFVWGCGGLQRAEEHWGPQGGNTKRTSRGY